MRQLRLRIARSGSALPMLVGAALLVPNCGFFEGTDQSSATVPRPTSWGTGGQAGLITPGDGSLYVPDTDDPGLCADGRPETRTLELPAEGVPATIRVLCAYDSSPLDSPGAATVRLASAGDNKLRGTIQLAPELEGRVLGLPVVSVASPSPQVTLVERTGTELAFELEFRDRMVAQEWAWFWLTVTLQVNCRGQEPQDAGADGDGGGSEAGTEPDSWRLVSVKSYWELCVDENGPVWRSSGEECSHCSAGICEMAATSLFPGETTPELPLPGMPSLRLRTVARVGRSLLVLSEHDQGAEGVEYAWQASGGELTRLAPDLVLWTPPDTPGDHLVQVCLESATGMALASLAESRAT